MTVAIVVLGILFYGAVIGGFLDFCRERRDGRPMADATLDRLPPTSPRRRSGQIKDQERLSTSYARAWDSLNGLAARLALLAVASDELATHCRQEALRGQPVTRPLNEPDYCSELPIELRHAGRRPGPTERWQALDRAIARLSAVHQSHDAGVHADAHEQLSIAARSLAEALVTDGCDADLEHCVFCRRGLDTVRLLATPLAAICGDCADACHERLMGS